MKINKIIAFIALGTLFAQCNSHEARKPISHTSGTFIKESIDRNKKLVDNEEQLIQAIIKKDTASTYLSSTKGYWYKYDAKVTDSLPLPVRGDVVVYEYEISDLDGKSIYTKEESKVQRYVVDKENIMMGLRYGLKQMKKGEQVSFYFPSHIAFGYHGDNDEIGTNQPIICKVKVNEIIKN
ncbi:MAG: gliding motility-associated peptidyl-prolyl isomerase GldI [Flavobacterium sp.]|nr:gliding motility-associated peptidyl-prolyl isomerase GldI [Candidatus Neoflavobacterium equi]